MKIFKGLTREILYKRCIMGQIAHAIMVPKFELLSAAQSWDGMNYNFMDFEGIRGTISFSKDKYVCVIQNAEKLIRGEKDAREYWIQEYEMTSEQAGLMEKIYQQKLHSPSNLILDKSIQTQLETWFGDIDESIESFKEINIYFLSKEL